MSDGWDIVGHFVSIGGALVGIGVSMRAWYKAADAAILAKKADDRAEEAHAILQQAARRDADRFDQEGADREAQTKGPIVLAKWIGELASARRQADKKSRGRDFFTGNCTFALDAPEHHWALAELAGRKESEGIASIASSAKSAHVAVYATRHPRGKKAT